MHSLAHLYPLLPIILAVLGLTCQLEKAGKSAFPLEFPALACFCIAVAMVTTELCWPPGRALALCSGPSPFRNEAASKASKAQRVHSACYEQDRHPFWDLMLLVCYLHIPDPVSHASGHFFRKYICGRPIRPWFRSRYCVWIGSFHLTWKSLFFSPFCLSPRLCRSQSTQLLQLSPFIFSTEFSC